jgi:hypothetical protein
MEPGTGSAQDSRSTCYLRSPDIVTRKIAGELFLVPIKGKIADMQRIFNLNPSGEFIWQRLDGQNTLADIRGQIMAEFSVEEGQAESDIQEFIDELIQSGLVLK